MNDMNSQVSNCGICYLSFNEDIRRPIVLSCNHHLCQSCAEKLFVNSPFCPWCSATITVTDMIPSDGFFASFLVAENEELNQESELQSKKNSEIQSGETTEIQSEETTEIQRGETTEIQSGENIDNQSEKNTEVTGLYTENHSSDFSLQSSGNCDEHNILNQLRCMDHKQWICGVCGMLYHRQCRTLLVEEALSEIKEGVFERVERELEKQKGQSDYIAELLHSTMDKRSNLKTKIKEVQINVNNIKTKMKLNSKCIDGLKLRESELKYFATKLKRFEKIVLRSADSNQFQERYGKLESFLMQTRRTGEELTFPRKCNDQITIELLKQWSETKSVFALRPQGKHLQYGQVEVRGGRVWVHSFQLQKPQGCPILISFRDLLLKFQGSSKLPNSAFLQLGDEDSIFGDVLVTTGALCPRSLNFLLLCLGVKGRSFKGNEVECCDPNFSEAIGTIAVGIPEAAVLGIQNGKQYEAPIKRGYVAGVCAETRKNILSGFSIWMKDTPSEKLLGKFGVVEDGLNMCEQVFSESRTGKTLYFRNCGLVI